MTERFQGHDPEKEHPSVRFGDVVRCERRNPYERVMITDVDENHYHSGITILDSSTNRYGFPGTIMPGEIIEVVDHIPRAEALDILVHALGEQMRDRVIEHYGHHLED